MTVATRDVSDFEVTGILLVNPWDFVMPPAADGAYTRGGSFS